MPEKARFAVELAGDWEASA
jgi:hypothetical protein